MLELRRGGVSPPGRAGRAPSDAAPVRDRAMNNE
jgi:hypothetical protein